MLGGVVGLAVVGRRDEVGGGVSAGGRYSRFSSSLLEAGWKLMSLSPFAAFDWTLSKEVRSPL